MAYEKENLDRKEVEAYHLALGIILTTFTLLLHLAIPFFFKPQIIGDSLAFLLLSPFAHGFHCRLGRGPLQIHSMLTRSCV